MSLEDLEKDAIEIEVNGKPKKVVEIKGVVTRVETFSKPIEISPTSRSQKSYTTGYQRGLNIKLRPEKSIDTKLLKFKGISPIRRGDYIRAGLILEGDEEGEILYVEIFEKPKGIEFGTKERSFDGFLIRRDLMDGYNPTANDIKTLRFEWR